MQSSLPDTEIGSRARNHSASSHSCSLHLILLQRKWKKWNHMQVSSAQDWKVRSKNSSRSSIPEWCIMKPSKGILVMYSDGTTWFILKTVRDKMSATMKHARMNLRKDFRLFSGSCLLEIVFIFFPSGFQLPELRVERMVIMTHCKLIRILWCHVIVSNIPISLLRWLYSRFASLHLSSILSCALLSDKIWRNFLPSLSTSFKWESCLSRSSSNF